MEEELKQKTQHDVRVFVVSESNADVDERGFIELRSGFFCRVVGYTAVSTIVDIIEQVGSKKFCDMLIGNESHEDFAVMSEFSIEAPSKPLYDVRKLALYGESDVVSVCFDSVRGLVVSNRCVSEPEDSMRVVPLQL